MNHKYIYIYNYIFITVRAFKTFDTKQVFKLYNVIVAGFKAKI